MAVLILVLRKQNHSVEVVSYKVFLAHAYSVVEAVLELVFASTEVPIIFHLFSQVGVVIKHVLNVDHFLVVAVITIVRLDIDDISFGVSHLDFVFCVVQDGALKRYLMVSDSLHNLHKVSFFLNSTPAFEEYTEQFCLPRILDVLKFTHRHKTLPEKRKRVGETKSNGSVVFNLVPNFLVINVLQKCRRGDSALERAVSPRNVLDGASLVKLISLPPVVSISSVSPLLHVNVSACRDFLSLKLKVSPELLFFSEPRSFVC